MSRPPSFFARRRLEPAPSACHVTLGPILLEDSVYVSPLMYVPRHPTSVWPHLHIKPDSIPGALRTVEMQILLTSCLIERQSPNDKLFLCTKLNTLEVACRYIENASQYDSNVFKGLRVV